MNRPFGDRGPGGGRAPKGGARPFDKFRRDGGFDRDQPVPDQRFGGPGKPGFPKPRDEGADAHRQGRGRFARDERDGFESPRSRFAGDSSRSPRRDDAPREERPFFPKSSPAPRFGSDNRAPRGREGFQDDRSAAPRPPRPFKREELHEQGAPFRSSERPRGSVEFQAPSGASRTFRAPRLPVATDPRPAREAKIADSVEDVEASELVCGIHPVEALLEGSSRRVQRILLLRANNDERLHRIQSRAEALKIPCQQIDSRYIEQRVPGKKHQGVLAICNAREYADWGVVQNDLRVKLRKGLAPVVLVGSAIEDPRNLGAIARTCVGLDVDALLLPMKGGCGLTALADETSAGALATLPVVRPKDLEKTLRELSEDGFTIVGLDAEGDDIRTIDFSGPIVLVAGGEDRGIPPHLRRPCDRVASIPMSNKLQSYNASVAAALALWEIRRTR